MRFGLPCKLLVHLLLLLLLVSITGCSVTEIAANRIVTAPNTHGTLFKEKDITKLWNLECFQPTNNAVSLLSVPVGPPEARLKIAELPPGDYHTKVESKVTTNKNGKYFLAASWLPQTNNTFIPLKSPATVVILHGYMLSKETMLPWAFTLAQSGFRVILVDLRGHGQSTGSQISFGKYETTDLSQLLDYLTEHNLCDKQVGVLGLSYGATLALHWAARDSRVQTVVSIAPYNKPDEAVVRFTKEMKLPFSQKTAQKAAVLAAQKMDIQWTDWSGEAAMSKVKVPVLFIGGGHDNISTPDDIKHLRQLAVDDSKIIEIPIANHIVLAAWYHELNDPIKTWFQDHLVTNPSTVVQKN